MNAMLLPRSRIQRTSRLAFGLALFGASLCSVAATSTPSPAAEVRAQARSASAPASGATAPSKRIPQPQTAVQAADKAQTPELKPENPVVPQLRIALGADRGGSAPIAGAGEIDDSAARCLAERSASARQACQDRRVPADRPTPAPAAPARPTPR